MGLRAGIDLVDVTDVDESLERWGERYLERIFTASEIAACRVADGRPRTSHLAAVLAAKEATFKVLLSGDDEMPWHCVEVTRQAAGRVSIRLSGTAQSCAERERIASISVSVTSRQDHAVAVVLAEIRDPRTPTTDEDVDAL